MTRPRRPSRTVLTLALGVIVAATWSAAFPLSARACTCAPWRPLVTYGQDPSYGIFTGWVGGAPVGQVDLGGAVATAFDFTVERWFAGPGRAATVRVASVGELGCGLELRGGEHLFTVAWRAREEAPWQPGICTPWAEADSPDGGRLLAEATITFGPGVIPALPPEAQPVDPRPPIALALGLAAVLAFILVRAFRHRTDLDE